MPHLQPFRALRYAPAAGPLSALLAPPYDVIDEALAERLRGRSPWNAVRLVLPEGDSPERYELAAARLREWRSDGVLARDSEPTVTLVRQTFDAPEGRSGRLAMFAALRLEPYGAGGIVPHERTHSGPRRDRLALSLATRTQLSPVFFAARDPSGALYSTLETPFESGSPESLRTEAPDGTLHEIRTVTGTAARSLCEAFAATALLIADGHHRYETALEVARTHAEGLPGADAVLACVVSDGDPGLRIRATHRCVHGRAPGDVGWEERLARTFELRDASGAGGEPLDPRTAAARAAEAGRIVVLTGGRILELIAIRREAVPGAGPALDEADAAVPGIVFDRFVVEGILGRDADAAARDGLLTYHRDPADGVRAAAADGALFLLPPAGLDAVRAVTSLGRRLPPKSTCFEPKIPSGLLFRPLTDD